MNWKNLSTTDLLEIPMVKRDALMLRERVESRSERNRDVSLESIKSYRTGKKSRGLIRALFIFFIAGTGKKVCISKTYSEISLEVSDAI